jgi:hypothetical protein
MLTLPVRIHIDAKQPIKAFLRQIQKQSVEAIPHPYLGLQCNRRLSEAAENACKFRNTLVVYPSANMADDMREISIETSSDNFKRSRTYAIATDVFQQSRTGDLIRML